MDKSKESLYTITGNITDKIHLAGDCDYVSVIILVPAFVVIWITSTRRLQWPFQAKCNFQKYTCIDIDQQESQRWKLQKSQAGYQSRSLNYGEFIRRFHKLLHSSDNCSCIDEVLPAVSIWGQRKAPHEDLEREHLLEKARRQHYWCPSLLLAVGAEL